MRASVAVGGGSVALAVGCAAWVYAQSGELADRLDKAASVGGLLVGLIGLLVTVHGVFLARRSGGVSPDMLVEHLAAEVGRRVRREVGVRELGPHALEVRWASTRRDVAESGALEGEVRELPDVLRAAPRLVVLGEAGAGKSVAMLLMVVRLLDGEGPVPVPLDVSRWAPDPNLSLAEWCARRIATLYPPLPGHQDEHEALCARLVESGRVLPVLDGLDEMPDGMGPDVVRELNKAVVELPGFVVSCRSDVYERAVADAGVIVAGTPVVEIQPVTVDALVRYLTAGRPPGDRRWDPVVDGLRADGPLAAVLSSPLMAWLARTQYSTTRSDPATLAAQPDEAALRQQLLDGYLPAVYGEHAMGDRRYDPARAATWLGHLAGHLRVLKAGPHLRCLDLHATVRPSRIGLVIGLMAALSWWGGRSTGAAAGTMLAAASVAVVPKVLRNVVGSLTIAPFMAAFVLMYGGTVAMFAKFVLPEAWFSADIAIGVGLVASFAALTVFKLWLTHAPANTRSFFDDDQDSFRSYNGIDGERDSDFSREPDPRAAVRRARVEFLGTWAVASTVATPVVAVLREIEFALAAGCVLGLLVAVQFSVWPYYAAARLVLAGQDRLPWRLVPFLEDAHRRGVFRQSGAVLQFRHLILQEHLASRFPLRPIEWSDGPSRGRGRGRPTVG